MLTNFVNYFLKPADTTTDDLDEHEQLESLSDEETDWVIVCDKTQDENVDPESNSRPDSRQFSRSSSRPISKSSSLTSLTDVRLDDSWYVTPPPGLTQRTPSNIMTSPLDDVNEHPSIAVYQYADFTKPKPKAKELKRAPRPAKVPERSAEQVPVRNQAATVAVPRRVQNVTLQQEYKQQCLSVRHAQKVQEKQVGDNLTKKRMLKNNKTRLMKDRCQRRNEKFNVLRANVNNNRKC